jgi:hypothetical protein
MAAAEPCARVLALLPLGGGSRGSALDRFGVASKPSSREVSKAQLTLARKMGREAVTTAGKHERVSWGFLKAHSAVALKSPHEQNGTDAVQV